MHMRRLAATVLGALGAALALAGLAALAADAVETAGSGFRLRTLGEWWFRLDRDSLQLAQPAIERHVAVWLWDPVALTLLLAPAAAVGLGAGIALLVAARATRRA
jgi:hypothetical protein